MRSRKLIFPGYLVLFLMISFSLHLKAPTGRNSLLNLAGTSHGEDSRNSPGEFDRRVMQAIIQNPENPYSETALIYASDAQTSDYFGKALALSGDTLAVGAYGEDGGPGDPNLYAGAVYIFERDLGGAENWGQSKILNSNVIQSGALFGLAVAMSGDTLVVGAPGIETVFIFERDMGGPGYWGETAVLQASDGWYGDYFGRALALSGERLVIGAPYQDDATGAAYLFERNAGGTNNWGEVAKLTASDASENDDFGISVDIQGDTMVVGAVREDGGPGNPLPQAGAAYVFERNLGGADNWGEAAILHASDIQTGDRFGYAVTIFADTLVVGSIDEDGGPGNPLPHAGAAYVFERNSGGAENWGETAILRASDVQPDRYFGESIDLTEDRLLVGAWTEYNTNVAFEGVVYVLERGTGGMSGWDETAILIAGNADTFDGFGSSVSQHGDTLAVGAFKEDGPNNAIGDSGAAYIFKEIQFTSSIFFPIITNLK